MSFIGKGVWGCLNKALHVQTKEKLLHRYFPVSFTKYFRTLFFAKHLWMTASAKYPFLFVTWISATKNVSLDLGYFKYFWGKHCELLVNSSVWRSWTDCQLWKSKRASDMSEILLEIESSHPAVFCKNEILWNFTNFIKKHLSWSHFL